MRSNRASKTGIQLKMFRKQLTKQFRGLSIIHTVEQCEGSNFSSGSQWLNLVRDEVILRKVNNPDSTPLDSIQLWQWGRSSTKPCRAGIFHLWSDDCLLLVLINASHPLAHGQCVKQEAKAMNNQHLSIQKKTSTNVSISLLFLLPDLPWLAYLCCVILSNTTGKCTTKILITMLFIYVVGFFLSLLMLNVPRLIPGLV